MTTGATLFTGGGGVDIGMRMAGVESVFGIEYRDDIAEVARANGVTVTVGNILEIDPRTVTHVDVLHASPPCPNFSNAKTGAKETPEDIALAEAVARIFSHVKPRWFTLENVPKYRRSQSFRVICDAVRKAGYMLHWQILNAADFGVPQTRRRLFLIASRDTLIPMMPLPVPWVGWYEAIEDLIPSLPDSEFAPWQLERMGDVFGDLVGAGGYEGRIVRRKQERPAFTITGNTNQAAQLRAFIVDDQNNGSVRENGLRGLTIRSDDEPTFTVSATQTNRSIRASANGRVVAMTPRCLARFQSFPDWYELPDNKALACRIIGNAVPPLLYRRLLEVML